MISAKPPVITWLPTRKCNLKCSYCRIRQSRFDDLDEEDIFRVIGVFKKHFSDAFVVVLGGDVTVWGKERLKRFVKQMGSLRYAIVTNGVLITEEWLRELIACGLKNISLSADPLGCHDRARKTDNASRLLELSSRLKVEDRHATLTLDRENFRGGPNQVRYLTKMSCWSEITPYIAYPSHDYDFGFFSEKLSFRASDYHEVNGVMKELIEMKAAGLLIHNTSEYLRRFAANVCREGYGYRCQGMTNLVVDADGSLRPCLHLRGQEMRRYNVLEWSRLSEVPLGKLHVSWKEDVRKQCHGCYWNCQWETEYIASKFRYLGPEAANAKVQDYFAHRST